MRTEHMQEFDLDAIQEMFIDVWTQLKSRVKELRALEEREAILRTELAEKLKKVESIRAELFDA